MNLFPWLPAGKVNKVDSTYPSDITLGISSLLSALGQKFKLDKTRAAELSDTTVATLGEGVFQVVRLDPSQSTAIGSAVKGRPVFWADEATFKVTCDAVLTSRFAGFLLETVTAKGNITIIQIAGRVGGLFDGTLTKGTPTVGNAIIFKIASTLATLDVIADATAVTGAIHNQFRHARSIVAATVTAGAVSDVWMEDTLSLHDEGVM